MLKEVGEKVGAASEPRRRRLHFPKPASGAPGAASPRSQPRRRARQTRRRRLPLREGCRRRRQLQPQASSRRFLRFLRFPRCPWRCRPPPRRWGTERRRRACAARRRARRCRAGAVVLRSGEREEKRKKKRGGEEKKKSASTRRRRGGGSSQGPGDFPSQHVIISLSFPLSKQKEPLPEARKRRNQMLCPVAVPPGSRRR